MFDLGNIEKEAMESLYKREKRMKNKKTFKYCENCDKPWEDISPPTKEAYQSGVIEIVESTVLLANPKKKKGCSVSHMKYINGIFCDEKCLMIFIKELRK